MNPINDKILVQSDGPFIKERTAYHINAVILLMISASVAAAAWSTGFNTFINLPILLISAAIAAAISSHPKKSLGSLDWLVSSLIAWIFISYQGYGALFSFIALGFLCGTLSSRKCFSKIVTMPGLAPLLSAGAIYCAAFFMGKLSSGKIDIDLIWRIKTWPELFTITLSGMLLASSAKSKWRFSAPWIMLIATSIIYSYFMPNQIPQLQQVCAELSSLLLCALFVAPQLCRNKLEMFYCTAVIFLIWGLYPYSALSGYNGATYMAAYLALLLFMPIIVLHWRKKKKFYEAHKKIISLPLRNDASSMQAAIRCGHQGKAPLMAEYKGFKSCRIASDQGGGIIRCPYGCLSFHDCVRACPHKAIKVGENNFPFVDSQLCVACSMCLSVCPKNLLTIIPRENKSFVPCAALDNLKKNADYCPEACIACGRCKKACPGSAIDRPDPLKGAMSVNHHMCLNYNCEMECMHACPQKIIKAQK